ncbi:unnamed protein product [Ostreobium quekettii]|uniref:Uncharacterized protein n=1 Tax=Ostreobium quekettii TaxID=121088 RepID=A0A8S1J217_9CHLO|nr:unnamed protein product [Ostreobium quekettii]
MTTWELLAAWAEFLLGIFGQRLLVRGVPPLDDIGDSLEGRTVIITGPTSGIGKSTAGALVRKGANVVLACRNPERGNELRQALLSNAKKLKGEGEGHASKGENGPSVEVMQLDIANPDSVRSFVESWKASGKAVHVLINNAGVFQMGGELEMLHFSYTRLNFDRKHFACDAMANLDCAELGPEYVLPLKHTGLWLLPSLT